MLLLDIIMRPRRVPDTTRVLPKPIVRDTVTVPSDTTDTVATSVNTLGDNMQLADIAPCPPKFPEMTGDDFSVLFWSVVVVLAALGLCFYFVRKYRETSR